MSQSGQRPRQRAVGQHQRPTAAAGPLYPAGPAELASAVDGLLQPVKVASEEPLAPAYLVPHGRLADIGATAAAAYARLREHAGQIQRVVVLAPDHNGTADHCVTSTADRWATPLGAMPLDVNGIRHLLSDGHVRADDASHDAETAIEVQLPFLQRVLRPETMLIPVLVGASAANDVAVTIAAIRGVGGAGTIVLCSAELSQLLDPETVRRQDERTVAAIVALAAERVGGRDTCAVYALRGLLSWARHECLHPRLLHLAHVPSAPTRVTGYAAISFDR